MTHLGKLVSSMTSDSGIDCPVAIGCGVEPVARPSVMMVPDGFAQERVVASTAIPLGPDCWVASVFTVPPGLRAALRTEMTLTTGLLGFVSGVIVTTQHLHELPAERVALIGAVGLGESLHNVGLALVLMMLAGLLTSVGALRLTRAPA